MISGHDTHKFRRMHRQIVLDDNKSIYIAGPLFSESERRYLESLVDFLTKELNQAFMDLHIDLHLDKYHDFFLPHRDIGDAGVVTGGNEDVFTADLRYLESAHIVIAWLDGATIDSGTAVELGYAFAKGKQIFGLLTDRRRWSGNEIMGLNNMVWGVCKGEERIYKINIYETKDAHDFLENKRLLDDLSKVLEAVKKIKLH
jgi:nucleoside 2-deoxyribosyltransferase